MKHYALAALIALVGIAVVAVLGQPAAAQNVATPLCTISTTKLGTTYLSSKWNALIEERTADAIAKTLASGRSNIKVLTVADGGTMVCGW